MQNASADLLSAGNRSTALRRWRSRVLRAWRWLFILYALALTIGTHWPRLAFGPEVPASDKMIHMLAFGGLTILLWRSGWFGSRWLVGVIAVAWAVGDEFSQGLPGLHRSVSVYDIIANLCGVVCAMALLWAWRPVHGHDEIAGPSLRRARIFQFTFDDMFAQRRPWVIAIVLLLASAALIAVGRMLLTSPRAVGVFGLVVAIVAVHVLYLIYRGLFFGRMREVLRDKPCLRCGGSAMRQARDAAISVTCASCGSDCAESDYVLPPRPSLRAVLRISLMPATVAILGVLALFAVVLLIPSVYGWTIASGGGRSTMPRLAQMLGRMPRETSSAIDLTIYALLIALVARLWRVRMATHLDRAVRCTRCGHDLRGTPINERGEGHCGECGEPFVRRFTTKATETREKEMEP